MVHWWRQFAVAAVLLFPAVGWCLETFPDDSQEQAQYWLDFGIKQAQQKEYEAAVKAIKQAIELQPRLQSAYYNLGFIYYQMGQPAAAVG